MTDSRFHFWQRWLTYANAMTCLVGALLAFAGNSFIFEMYNNYSEAVFFKAEEFSPDVLNFKNWLCGIIGATIVGYHLLMIFISENAFKKKERWAYMASWTALISWFLIDSSISYFYGAIHNIVMINLVALVLIGLPLVMTRKEFVKKG